MLDRIDAQGRDPDEWEARYILEAFGAVASHMYVLAHALAEKAGVPPEERAGEWSRKDETPTVLDLRVGLQAVGAIAAPNAH